MQEYFNSNYELVHSLASKYIIGVTYKENTLPVFTYVTLNESIIGDDINIKMNHSSGPDLDYVFYDLLNKKWFTYDISDEISYQYYNCDISGVYTPGGLYDINDIELINKVNTETLKLVDAQLEQKDKLKVDIEKYNTKYDIELFNIYYQLLLSETLTYDQALFSIVFNITLNEYKNDKITKIQTFKKTFKNVINVFKEQAITNINKEMAEGGVAPDEDAEMEVIKTMITDAVKASEISIDSKSEPWEILEDFPTILLPIPGFIEDTSGEDSFTRSKIAIQKL